ncbi:MAG: WD40 repeat domain-containing protein, partial [Planctomycetota bacterium]
MKFEIEGGEADDARLEVQLSHDGNLMAVGRSWGKVRIYDLAAGKVQRDLEIGGGLGRILLKPDGSSLVSCGPFGPPEVWSLTDGGPGVPLTDNLPSISVARFAPGGETLALGLPDGSVFVVDPGRPEPVRLTGGHAT